VLRRTGFGASGPQIDAVAKQDLSTYLDRVLSSDPDADPGAQATPLPALPHPPWAPQNNTALQVEYHRQVDQQMGQLYEWWLSRLLAVKDPIHEKLTLLWHNHFATSADKVGRADLMAKQNQALRTLKLGDFRTLAYAMLTDGAMLIWLDGLNNTATAPNENLAREFMELFALGHGNGYTEADVKEGARALTGWVVGHSDQPEFSPERHDAAAKTVLGITGNLDAAAFCDAVLAAPNSARYVAARMWQQLASDDPPSPQALDRIVAAYGPGRDLKALTKAILTDPEFISAPGTVVNTPVEWLTGLVRTLKVDIDPPERRAAFGGTLAKLGQRPFYPPDVGGWPRGQTWLSTSSTALRLWAAQKLAQLGDLTVVDRAGTADRIDAAGYLLGIGAWSDRTASALKQLVSSPPQLVAAAANSPEYLTS
jgi:uncharacterized protein (DUF1800 family)